MCFPLHSERRTKSIASPFQICRRRCSGLSCARSKAGTQVRSSPTAPSGAGSPRRRLDVGRSRLCGGSSSLLGGRILPIAAELLQCPGGVEEETLPGRGCSKTPESAGLASSGLSDTGKFSLSGSSPPRCLELGSGPMRCLNAGQKRVGHCLPGPDGSGKVDRIRGRLES